MSRLGKVASTVSILLFASSVLLAAAGDKGNAKGIITDRTGETLIVKTDGGNITVVLDDNTETRDRKGLFGLDKERMSDAVLIPGLKVSVNGSYDDQNRIVAKTITVDGDDLETAEMIQAGLHPTAKQVLALEQNMSTAKQDISASQQDIAASKQDISKNSQSIAAQEQQINKSMKDIEEATNRFTSLSAYDVKDQATVKFPVGSANIADADKEQLKTLATNALGVTGYLIEVTGFTDSTGTPAINQKLSEDRAKAVIAYLMQEGGIPIRRIVAPGAMGIYQPVATNETREGRTENRRAEVKVLVNKGIAGN